MTATKSPNNKPKVKESKPLEPLEFQREPIKNLVEGISKFYETGNNVGRLVVLPTRCGKTFVAGFSLKEIQDKYPQRKWNNHIPFERWMTITPSSVKTQFQRVLTKLGVKHFVLTSPTSMSHSFGDGNLKWISTVRNGVMTQDPVWDNDMKPDAILLDECQWVKNDTSNIHQVIVAAAKQGILVIFISATPFTTLKESLCVCIGLKLCRDADSHRIFCNQFILNNQDYSEPNHAAMKRFNDFLVEKGLKIEAHNIKFKHRVFNKCLITPFRTRQQAEHYKTAYDRYIEEMAKHDKHTPEGWGAILAAMTKFRETAEALRSDILALRAKKYIDEGYQVIVASNFRITLDILQAILINKLGVPAHRVGIIIGGQSADTRQNYIDKFQRGELDCIFLTLKSGGAGLSLHHEFESARPRRVLLPPTYSAIEQVQVLGRAHGPTSLSTTYQEIIWFSGGFGVDCIENHVARVVSRKMRSLKEIVYKRETYFDLLTPEGGFNTEDLQGVNNLLNAEQDEKDENNESLVDGLALDAFQEDSDSDVEEVKDIEVEVV